MSDVWTNADPDAGGSQFEEVTLEPPADGKITAVLEEGFAGTGKESGKPFVALTWKCLASGYKWKVIGGFKSQGQANMTKAMVRDLGIPVDTLAFDDVAPALAAKAGSYYSLTVKRTESNGKVWPNTYVDGPASGGIKESDLASPPIGEPVTAPTADSHVPFRARFDEGRSVHEHNPFAA